MDNEKKLESIQNFIFNDEVQNTLSKINDNVMDFNILEITGMGNQEIKHSNILGWLFDDTEHNLEYQILDNFLKKVIKKNSRHQLKSLQEYLYLSNNKRNITIYREKDNIDLLIVDESNKIVITIENKVYADERTELENCDGEELGQLDCYEKRINAKYQDYNKYFIFLTIDLEEPSKDNWLKANHLLITNTIEDILKIKETTTKTKIILESYVDLLKRNGIVEDKELKQLCEKIWLNKEYSEALNILMQHKTTITKIFYDKVLQNELNFFDDSVFLQLDGIEALYKSIGLNCEDEKEIIFDITCEYESGDIVLYFSHHKLLDQNEKFQNICFKLKKRNSKKYEEIKRYTMNMLIDKGEEYFLKDIKKTINQIDKKILNLVNE